MNLLLLLFFAGFPTIALAASIPPPPSWLQKITTSLLSHQDGTITAPNEPITILPDGAGICATCDEWLLAFYLCAGEVEGDLDVTPLEAAGCLCGEGPWAQLVACNECVLERPDSQTGIYLKEGQEVCLELGYDVSLYDLPDETPIVEPPNTPEVEEDPTKLEVEVEIESAASSSLKLEATPTVGGVGGGGEFVQTTRAATTRAATETGVSVAASSSDGARESEVGEALVLGLAILTLVLG